MTTEISAKEGLTKREWFIQFVTNTEWFNQFDDIQKIIIKVGLQNDLDVFKYAKKEFDANQMIQIRNGLKDNLDVAVYAKPEYSWQEMSAIRKSLLKEKTI